MTTTRGIILPPYKASFAARLPVGGVMRSNSWVWVNELERTERT